MAKQKKAFREVISIARCGLWDSLIAAVFYVWVFVLLFNNAPFSWTENILLPIRFFILAAAVSALFGFVACLCVRLWSERISEWMRFFAYAFAALSLLAIVIGGYLALPMLPFAIIASISAGFAISLYAYASFGLFIRMDIVSMVTSLLCTFAIAVIIFLLMIVLLLDNSLLLALMLLLLFCAVSIMRDRTKNSFSVRLNESRSMGARQRLSTSALASQTVICVLLFICGTVLAFEWNVTQKSLHFPGIAVATEHIGGTAMIAVYYLLLTLALLVVIEVHTVKPSVPLAGSVAAILLANTFFWLPYLTMANFILVTACVSALLCITLLLFFKLLRALDVRIRSIKLFSIGFLLLAAGGLAGGGLAHTILADFTSWRYFDELFKFAPAVFMLAILVILLLSYQQIGALAQRSLFKEELDSSKLENRCEIIADRYLLTNREREVLKLLSQGRNVPGVASVLNISHSTAKTHTLRIYRKIGVSSHQELIGVLYEDSCSIS